MDKIATLEDLQTFLESLRSLYKVHDTEFIIVEEEFHLKSMMESALTKEGFKNIIYLKDGREVFEHLEKTTKNNLVIYNLKNSYLNGVEFLKQINNSRLARQPKVMLICSAETEKIATQLLKMGAQAYLKKPFSVQEFIATLKQLKLL